MEQITSAEHGGVPLAGRTDSLPADSAEWPDEARRAFRYVLRQLDSWSREHNHTRHSNVWIAEEAVRQTW